MEGGDPDGDERSHVFKSYARENKVEVVSMGRILEIVVTVGAGSGGGSAAGRAGCLVQRDGVRWDTCRLQEERAPYDWNDTGIHSLTLAPMRILLTEILLTEIMLTEIHRAWCIADLYIYT